MNIKFRRMTMDDAPAVHRLEQKIFPDAWPLKSFTNEVENERLSYPCVMMLNGQLVGYAVAWFYADELHITNFAIDPDFQRQRLGSQLMQHLLAKYHHHEATFLEVRRSNAPAIQLYRKFGFEELFVRETYYSDGEDAIVMVRSGTRIY